MRSNHYTMKARNAIKHALANIDNDAHIGIGCSGGADSLALMYALSTLYKDERAKLVHIVIVDHQLQDATAEISSFTADRARDLGFNAHIVPVDITSTSEGMESDARRARYEAFESVIAQYDLEAFLIGHTKTDQAEQVFLGMLRGSGTRSLSGIPESRGVFKRPFLNALSRKETQTVCNEFNVIYWNDPHNDSLEYKRVSIRNLISETEKATGQDIVNPLVRTAAISAEDADALDFYADIEYEKTSSMEWQCKELINLPVAIRKRMYHKKLLTLVQRSDMVTSEKLNRVDELVSAWKGQGAVNIGDSVYVYRENSELTFDTE